MPLHTIPLCSFSYVGGTLSGAIFQYDVREKITKNKTKLYYKENLIEIEKAKGKMFYKNNIDINGFKNEKLLYEDSIDIYKTKIKTIKKHDVNINLESSNRLNKEEINIIKNIEFNLTSDNPELYKVINMQLKDTYRNKNIVINTSKELEQFKTNIEMNKNTSINLIRNNILNLNINNKNKYLNRQIKEELLINKLKELERFIRIKEIDKNNLLFTERNNNKNLDIYKDKFIDKEKTRDLDVVYNDIYFYTSQKYDIFKIHNKYIDRINNKKLIKPQNTILTYKDLLKDIFKLKQFNVLYKDLLKDIYKFKGTQFIYKDFRKSIFKSSIEFLDKEGTEDVFKIKENYLDKDKVLDIFEHNIKSVEDISFRNIYKGNLYGLNKTDTEIYKEIKAKGLNKYIVDIWKDNQYGLNKFGIDITKNIYNITDLEVIKRWWVLKATSPTDQKILPMDYNYLKKPLSINRRDREYGELVIQENHPISFMPYLEGNVGIDLSYGLEETNLSIEIMIDMINIVGMIVQHGASQFANCSGQEAMEFIMEVLLDWLNMDSTIHEMQLKGSREHYLRYYRWIRWEAEKVWFTADEDHTQDKMMGIKYAGMLFANLLDYMKYHHFNVVPLWRNLKYMDIERQFNKIATNGDITKELDKLKSKRHYLMETQNFERKNILGGN